jgi:hypothetical protein
MKGMTIRRFVAACVAVLAASSARADDRLATGYVVSRPIVRAEPGIAHAIAARYERGLGARLEIGIGIQAGYSSGTETLWRAAVLPGIALTFPLDAITLRIEEQGGWQVVHGRVTLDGIPLAGTETRSFHNELSLAIDAPLSRTIDLRARAGVAIDGLFPAGHVSIYVGPFVGVAVIVRSR